jgi:hypothetical protein
LKIKNCELQIANCKLQNGQPSGRTELFPQSASKKRVRSCCESAICNLQFAIYNLQFLLFFCVLAFGALCVGCRREAAGPDHEGSTDEVLTSRYHENVLDSAIDSLNRAEEFNSREVLEQIIQRLDPRNASKPDEPSGKPADSLLASWPESEMLRQAVDRLNQWIRTQAPPSDWKLDPMVAALPKTLAALPPVKDLGEMEFSRLDGFALQEAVWLRDISKWARGDVIDELQRARNLFDWTIRNIQLEPDGAQHFPQFPWETLLYGRGTAAERAWVFMLLLRQLDIDSAVLAVEMEPGAEGKAVEQAGKDMKGEGRGAKGEGKVANGQAKNTKPAPPPKPEKEKAPSRLRLWCVGVLIEGKVYLFDTLLGLPIPAPGGVSVDAGGQLAIQPATLSQAANDDKVLRQMDADESHGYGLRAAQLARVVALLEASPPYLARRMKLLDSQLTGERRMVLTTDPSARARRWQEAKQIADARLWLQPLQVLQLRSHLPPQAVQYSLKLALPLYMVYKETVVVRHRDEKEDQRSASENQTREHAGALGHGRVLQLKGKFTGEEGATRYFQLARPSNEIIRLSSEPDIEKILRLQAKFDATYWSGLIAFERGKTDRHGYQSAIDYFTNRTRPPLVYPNGPWSVGAQYNLARAYEASGQTQRAILQYGNNDSSPGYLGDLLRAKWLRDRPK